MNGKEERGEKPEALLKLFLDKKIPETGPEEDKEIDPPFWRVAKEGNPWNFPGGGLSRYPMLYIGEGCNKIFLISGGKIIWTYSTGKGWEYDDIWMLSDGNVLFSRMAWAGKVTPQKKLIWRYSCRPDEEIHTLQPVGLERVYMLINGKPPKMVLADTVTGSLLWEKEIPCDPRVSVHGQFRRFRYTPQNTFLISHLSENKVVEYDKNMKEIWSYRVKGPWAAVRLKNGNTLITAEGEDRTLEVNSKGETVWEIRLEELPLSYRLEGSQSCVRLENGNTILCSRGDNGNTPQLVEVTEDKQVVWCIKDWKNLGPATAIQILSEKGIPEVPGDCQR